MSQKQMYLGAVFMWIISILLWIFGITYWVFLAFLILHTIELLFIGLKVGKDNNISLVETILMCLLFGIIWWKPLKK